LQIIVEGWRFLPHSYAIANQFQLLEMLKYPNLEIFHKDIPYLSDLIIITPSHWSRTGFIRSGANPDRTIVIPCGIDPNIYKPLTKSEREALRKQLGWDGFVFLNVGAGTPNKGIDLLLKAFAVVVESYPEARLVLKGEESVYASDSLKYVSRRYF
jgi:glycosyltransferase involved in cell wall biosynthesis